MEKSNKGKKVGSKPSKARQPKSNSRTTRPEPATAEEFERRGYKQVTDDTLYAYKIMYKKASSVDVHIVLFDKRNKYQKGLFITKDQLNEIVSEVNK